MPRLSAGNSRLARMAMIAIATSNSINVNALSSLTRPRGFRRPNRFPHLRFTANCQLHFVASCSCFISPPAKGPDAVHDAILRTLTHRKSLSPMVSPQTKKPKCTGHFGFFWKNWRQPTLAESIKPLPSARLCLTAEFGMGSGRTTALWPPKINFKFQI